MFILKNSNFPLIKRLILLGENFRQTVTQTLNMYSDLFEFQSQVDLDSKTGIPKVSRSHLKV